MLKNYTSMVPALRSIAYIEAKLIEHGATQIVKFYGPTGMIASLCFVVPLNGVDIPFRLPARVFECEKKLKQNLSPRAKSETIQKIPQQAERTAWKILSDWVEAQMAMIELAQVEFTEVFMPYIFNHQKGQTVFEIFKEHKFKALLTDKAGA